MEKVKQVLHDTIAYIVAHPKLMWFLLGLLAAIVIKFVL